eukprot:1187669-Prorocentrum_minimum.AAC.2
MRHLTLTFFPFYPADVYSSPLSSNRIHTIGRCVTKPVRTAGDVYVSAARTIGKSVSSSSTHKSFKRCADLRVRKRYVPFDPPTTRAVVPRSDRLLEEQWRSHVPGRHVTWGLRPSPPQPPV